MELTKALDAVIVEVPLKDLSVGQSDSSSTLLGVVHQHALIEVPVVFKEVEVGVVEGSCELCRVVVVHFAISVELIL